MLFSDEYIQAVGESSFSLRERGSRFLGFAYAVKSEEEFKSKLHLLKSEYPDATHHCFAFVLNPDKSAQRASDDGEPSNSAGKPILRAILSRNLTNVAVVVVRYFGGTQLGIPGLISAYGSAAAGCLDLLKTEQGFIEDTFTITCDFSHEQDLHRMIPTFKARILRCTYSNQVEMYIAVKRSLADDWLKMVNRNHHLTLKKQ
jgi:uncharacterized YigZ family protein